MYQHDAYLSARIAKTHARELRAEAAEHRDAMQARSGRTHRTSRLRGFRRSVLSVFESIVPL